MKKELRAGRASRNVKKEYARESGGLECVKRAGALAAAGAKLCTKINNPLWLGLKDYGKMLLV